MARNASTIRLAPVNGWWGSFLDATQPLFNPTTGVLTPGGGAAGRLAVTGAVLDRSFAAIRGGRSYARDTLLSEGTVGAHTAPRPTRAVVRGRNAA